MAQLGDIREGFATALREIDGLQAYAYMLAQPTLPAAWVIPDEIEYDMAFGRGHDDWYMLVQVFVSSGIDDLAAQKRLDQMLASAGPLSVKEALEADATLGDLIEDLRVETCSGYRTYPRQDGSMWLGAEWRVKVVE